jgi:hypothetical protein
MLPVRLRPDAWVVTYGVLAYWRGRVQFLEVAVILLGGRRSRWICCRAWS